MKLGLKLELRKRLEQQLNVVHWQLLVGGIQCLSGKHHDDVCISSDEQSCNDIHQQIKILVEQRQQKSSLVGLEHQ